MLASWINNFLSLLVVFPGHPNQGPLYLVKGLLNALQSCEGWDKHPYTQSQVFLNMFSFLFTSLQPRFPYHVAGGRNDLTSCSNLFKSSPMTLYLEEVKRMKLS